MLHTPRSTVSLRINIAAPIITDEEIEAVTRVLLSGMIASGPETRAFESDFAAMCGVEHAIATSNCTTALSAALLGIGVGPGDEVITTPLTFVATANSILSCGATPVFADINEDTFNLSPYSVEGAVTDRTKAVIPVHLYGLPADMDAFQRIGEENNIRIIGDAAQAHGAAIGQRPIGSTADLECFSFYPTKNMTTGEGGMVTTNDEEIHAKVKSIVNHGRPSATLGNYEHEIFGLNFRLTDIASAIGRVQLRRLAEFNSIRTRNAGILIERLTGFQGVKLPTTPDGLTHVWHQFTIQVPNRTGLAEHLKSRGIGCGIYYPRLVYEYPHLKQFKSHCEIAESIVDRVISLPIHPGLEEGEVEEVAEAVGEWLQVN